VHLGWTNQETWAAFNWLTSYEDHYNQARLLVQSTQLLGAEEALRDYLEEILEYEVEITPGPMQREFFHMALNRVALEELVEALREEEEL